MNGDQAKSPRKATSPKLAPVKATGPNDDDDMPISSKTKTPVASSPKVTSVKPPPEDEDDKPLSAKSPKITSPKAAVAAAKTPILDDAVKSIGTKSVTSSVAVSSAPSPRDPSSAVSSSAASRAAPTPVVPSAPASAAPKTPTVATPDLQSILSKVKALAAQSAVSQSARPASSAPSSKRPKVLSSDDDDDQPLSARAGSSVKPHSSSSASKQKSSSSSKQSSSHSTHDQKKRDRDRSPSSKSRGSGALLGDASSEFKSVGHVFLSSDRGIVDKLIAGILSRWWCVALCLMPPSSVCANRLSQVRHRVAPRQLPALGGQDLETACWFQLCVRHFAALPSCCVQCAQAVTAFLRYEGPDGRIHNIRDAVAAATKGAATVDPQKMNVGPPTYDNLATMGKKDLKNLLLRVRSSWLHAPHISYFCLPCALLISFTVP